MKIKCHFLLSLCEKWNILDIFLQKWYPHEQILLFIFVTYFNLHTANILSQILNRDAAWSSLVSGRDLDKVDDCPTLDNKTLRL